VKAVRSMSTDSWKGGRREDAGRDTSPTANGRKRRSIVLGGELALTSNAGCGHLGKIVPSKNLAKWSNPGERRPSFPPLGDGLRHIVGTREWRWTGKPSEGGSANQGSNAGIRWVASRVSRPTVDFPGKTRKELTNDSLSCS
jgi:hypothetical protein